MHGSRRGFLMGTVAAVCLAGVLATGAASQQRAPTATPTAAPPAFSRTDCRQHLPAGWVAAENRRPGSSAWIIPAGLPKPVATGYASASTAVCGQVVSLFVQSAAPYRLQVWRMGYYGGSGARRVWQSGLLPARHQVTRLGPGEAANWAVTTRVWVRPSYPPGMYLVKLVPVSGTPSFIPLAVRSGYRPAPGAVAGDGAALVQLDTHTWQAYNRWGGADAYHGRADTTAGRLTVMSYARPYRGDGTAGFGDGQFLQRDRGVVLALERAGIDTVVTTDEDVGLHPWLLDGARVVILGGHAEYQTPQIFDRYTARVAAGMNLVNLGPDALYWRVRPGPNRTYVVAKSRALDASAPTPRQTTVRFRDAPAATPEAGLLGGQFDCLRVKHVDARVVDASRWPWPGTGATSGMTLGGVVQQETDRYVDGISPARTEVLAHAEFECPGHHDVITAWDLVYTAAPGQGGVFSVGTMGWMCALEGSCPAALEPLDTQAVITAATLNVIRAALAGPLGNTHPSAGNAAQVYIVPFADLGKGVGQADD